MSETQLLYLSDTYNFACNTVLVSHGKDESKGSYVVLAETVFYPQGGGQPSDIGIIELTGSNRVLTVHFVGLVNGSVYHYVKEDVDDLESGSVCSIRIDSERRLKNAKSHTSGHLLASIVESIAPELVGVKGYHFPEGPYVEFKGKLSSISQQELMEKVKSISTQSIESGASVNAREVDPGEVKDLAIQVPPGKKVRLVRIEGFEAVPCGGTHLKSLSELKDLSVRKIQSPKDLTRISYSFA